MRRTAIKVIVRDNVDFANPVEVSEEPLVIVNRYSDTLAPAIRRAWRLSTEMNHHNVRIEHFIYALFVEPTSQQELREHGFVFPSGTTLEELCKRFAHFESTVGQESAAMAIREPTPRLKAWFDAAQQFADDNDPDCGRDPEHNTVTIKDFLSAVDPKKPIPESSPLWAVQNVLKIYGPTGGPSYVDEMRKGFKDGATNVVNSENRLRSDIIRVEQGVGRVDARVGEVQANVSAGRLEARGFRADAKGEFDVLDKRTNAIHALLPAEIAISRFATAVAFLGVAATGSLLGLVARWHFGVL